MDLDPQQRMVVTAPADVRMLVEAGPGCGKTHVACERVAHLLNQGEIPDRILLLSFTRTAVHDLRKRIAAASSVSAELARQVQVRTLDSFAWRLSAGASELGSHDASIRAALAATERAFRGDDPDIEAWVRGFIHVIVDEAQDLVDARASLVIALLNGLPPGAGWTVFMDPAQAIYGWSSDAEDEDGGERFLDLLPSLQGSVQRRSLTTVHRTSKEALLDLLRRARALTLEGPSGQRLGGVRTMLAAGGEDAVHGVRDLPALLERIGEAQPRTLVLVRRRVDALLSLSYIRDAGLSCRLRVGGMPRLVAPWIAAVANELAVRGSIGSITNASFLDAWQSVCHGRRLADSMDPELAWRLLLLIGGTDRLVDLRKVAKRLAMGVVPDEVSTREIGVGGATIGTVHGSKGREAEHVVFYLPGEGRPSASDAASDEEARVLYVAASRAKEQLDVLPAASMTCGYHENRAWRAAGRGLQIEIGREGDIDGCTLLPDEDAKAVQDRLAAFDGKLCPVHVHTRSEGSWTRMLQLGDGATIGALSSECVNSLGSLVTSRAKKKTSAPLGLGHLTWLDTTTVALSPNDPRVERLLHPWRETRLVLAPVIAGMGYLKRYW
jgi:hypothetical protein